jgi:competence protein ComEA
MGYSLLIKFAMLIATVAAVLWIGWPAPKEEARQTEPVQPAAAQVPAAPPMTAAIPEKAGSKVNLNRASADELQTLPGVGPVLAQRMVEWRKAHGRYRTIDDLQEVKGIGKKRMEQLRPLVTVLTRIIHGHFCCNHGFAAATSLAAGDPAAKRAGSPCAPSTYCFKYASGSPVSTRPSRYATA